MAVVAVTAGNTRVEDGEAYTGWANIGSGAGGASEGSFFYQGTKLANRKITDATGKGLYYDPTVDGGTAQDMTATAKRTWMVKAIVTDFGGLQTTNGFRMRIGSGTSAYYEFIIAGSNAKIPALDAYPAKGGFIIVPIDPNISGYRDSTTGSPVLTAVDYFGIVAAFATASAKSENVGCDAIDLGTGLTLVGGDGASTDGVFQDFIDADEGTINNRWGFAASGAGVMLLYGSITIGSATATVFTDTGEIIFFPDGLYQAGWSNLTLDLQNATTDISISSNITSLGTTTVEDTRADHVVTGTSGTYTLTGTLVNFRNVTMTSACTLDGADVECVLLTQSSCDISGGTTIRTNALTSVACLQDPTFGTTTDLHDTTFVQSGAGHAIEIATATSYTFTNLFFTGYGANTTDSAAIDVTATSGTVTISVSGGDTPTYKTAGATVVINNSVTVQVTVKDATTQSVISGARVLLLAATGGDLPFEDSVTITRSGTTASVSHTAHGLSNGDKVNIKGANQSEYNGIKTISNVSTNAYDYTVTGSPTTPATGTIKSTAVILDGTTNVSGVIEDTGFNFTTTQPVSGKARKGTTSPLYQTGPISGSIVSGSGFTATVFLVSDE